SSYYWLCNALDLYCPVQWEYDRLNLQYIVVSKRKIVKLIENNIVRVMVVLDPLKVTITNFPNERMTELAVLNFPVEESRGSHPIQFDSVMYIEKSDISENLTKDFKRLTPNQPCGLKHVALVITTQDIIRVSLFFFET
ncbi:unnamed protein product, partial [Rotaria sp. Silwood2]